MKTVGIYYGSTTGNTANAARLIEKNLKERVDAGERIVCVDIAHVQAETVLDADWLILGVSTWNVGDLQEDWEDALVKLAPLDFSGKKVALFGLGDQYGYADTFQDGLGILADALETRGAILVGRTATDGYDFEASLAVRDDTFVGLALDEDNQGNLTAKRIENWVTNLMAEFALDLAPKPIDRPILAHSNKQIS